MDLHDTLCEDRGEERPTRFWQDNLVPVWDLN